ncbi:ABC transporter permease subunit [Cohnella sp. CFH 77786]|uniref:ABC transporter permease n=1 Tax=Cohnella sp. CFH 77786 TaxID=2662265 RepID=UPI001C60DE25|nr:ABC transporter permease [Cohnella sp. CFH 77786]MBW5448713.1 ABC transporter permease subunit [Cohnella sp. CFH 77786]
MSTPSDEESRLTGETGGERRGLRAATKSSSPQYESYLRFQKRKLVLVWGSRFALLAALLAVWELAAARHWIDPMLTSQPSQLLRSFRELAFEGNLLMHTRITAWETIVSMAVSMTLGVAIAVLLWLSSFASRVIEPYMVVLNALPKVALGPIFYIWLGDRYSIYGMAIAISLVVTVIMAENGFREISKTKLKLMESLGASRMQMLRMVLLPASIPNMIATLKVNVGLTLVGVVMGEFLSSKAGLGYLILYGGQVFQMNMVMVSIAMLALLSVILYGIVNGIGYLASRVHPIE